jgi:hypothetical protein
LRRCLPLALLALLGGCGKPLGSYVIEKARLAPAEELDRVESLFPSQWPEGPIIRIDFSSTTDVVAAADGDLYVDGDFCPAGGRYRFAMFGPYPDGQKRFTDAGTRRPVRDAAGRYHYVAYLRTVSTSDPAFDLRRTPRDLCLRIHSAGYHLTPSQSEVFILRGQIVARLVGGG